MKVLWICHLDWKTNGFQYELYYRSALLVSSASQNAFIHAPKEYHLFPEDCNVYISIFSASCLVQLDTGAPLLIKTYMLHNIGASFGSIAAAYFSKLSRIKCPGLQRNVGQDCLSRSLPVTMWKPSPWISLKLLQRLLWCRPVLLRGAVVNLRAQKPNGHSFRTLWFYQMIPPWTPKIFALNIQSFLGVPLRKGIHNNKNHLVMTLVMACALQSMVPHWVQLLMPLLQKMHRQR